MPPVARRLLSCLTAATVWLAAPGAAAAGTGLAAPPPAAARDDGLARTPPMGFNNWNTTGCGDEFDAEMVRRTADIFVAEGLREAGYEYVNIDDCWALPERGPDGNLVPDPERFPQGIEAVADYVHGKGLKFGIYTSAGTSTCANPGFPGALGHEQQDADLFASWGVDYLKYDNCNNEGVDAIERYTAMRDALRNTGRPIVFSICEWGQNEPWTWAEDVGHLWRTTGDISDNWSSMLSIAKRNLPLAPYAGPGHWNDPDMLEVGNGGMTGTEYRSHFSLWAMMAAPLLIGTDLREAGPETFEILGNRDIIALDQDPLGKQGTVLSSDEGRWVIGKELADGDRAVALFNETGTPQHISTTAGELGLPASPRGYRARDLWQHTDFHTTGTVAATVPAHGTVVLRLSTQDAAPQDPPLLDTGVAGTAPHVRPGETTTVTTYARNLGRLPAQDLRVGMTAPEGWRIEALDGSGTETLEAGERLETTWRVTVPEGAETGGQALPGSVVYRVPGHREPVTVPLAGQVTVYVPPPSGTSSLSGLEWTSAVNGWGPVERDTSVGEAAAGDGNPITIGGTSYDRGLGVHADSAVEFYLGGRCTSVTAVVGVDDEKDPNGSVVFRIEADGQPVAESGVLTNDMVGVPIEADVSGAESVRLVVTDAGDGKDSDHADWAEAELTC